MNGLIAIIGICCAVFVWNRGCTMNEREPKGTPVWKSFLTAIWWAVLFVFFVNFTMNFAMRFTFHPDHG